MEAALGNAQAHRHYHTFVLGVLRSRRAGKDLRETKWQVQGPCVCLLASLVGFCRACSEAQHLNRVCDCECSPDQLRVSVSHSGWAWLCEVSGPGVCSRVIPWPGRRLSQSARLRACVRVNTALPRVARVLACARKSAAAAELASP